MVRIMSSNFRENLSKQGNSLFDSKVGVEVKKSNMSLAEFNRLLYASTHSGVKIEKSDMSLAEFNKLLCSSTHSGMVVEESDMPFDEFMKLLNESNERNKGKAFDDATKGRVKVRENTSPEIS